MTTAEKDYEQVSARVPATGELLAVTLGDGTRVCVGNADGRLFGVQDACTHSAFSLAEGTLLSGGVLQCSWHGAFALGGAFALVGLNRCLPIARLSRSTRCHVRPPDR